MRVGASAARRRAVLLVLTASAGCRLDFDRAGAVDARPITGQVDGGADASAPLALRCGEAVRLADLGPASGATPAVSAVGALNGDGANVLAVAWDPHEANLAVSGWTGWVSADAIRPLAGPTALTTALGSVTLTAVGDGLLLAVGSNTEVELSPWALDLTSTNSRRVLAGGGLGNRFAQRGLGPDRVIVATAISGGTTPGVALTEVDQVGFTVMAEPRLTPATASPTLARVGNGYAALITRTSDLLCDLVALDAALDVTRGNRLIDMTCHEPAAAALGGDSVALAWNCDNDAVWLMVTPPAAATLPAYRAVYTGSAAEPATSPRLGRTSAGTWYTYRIGAEALGAALLDGTGAELRAPAELVRSSKLGGYDLAVANDRAFLVWTQHLVRDELWAMPLCP